MFKAIPYITVHWRIFWVLGSRYILGGLSGLLKKDFNHILIGSRKSYKDIYLEIWATNLPEASPENPEIDYIYITQLLGS